MAFDIDIGYTSLTGKKPVNEDFCAAMLPDAGQASLGAICAIADGVSTGGDGKEAAQTTVMSLVRDYFGTPDTWDTSVALERVIAAQNTWLVGINQRRKSSYGLTTLTAIVLRGQSYTLAHVGDTRAYLLRDGELSLLTNDQVVDHPDMRHQLLRCGGHLGALILRTLGRRRCFRLFRVHPLPAAARYAPAPTAAPAPMCPFGASHAPPRIRARRRHAPHTERTTRQIVHRRDKFTHL